MGRSRQRKWRRRAWGFMMGAEEVRQRIRHQFGRQRRFHQAVGRLRAVARGAWQKTTDAHP